LAPRHDAAHRQIGSIDLPRMEAIMPEQTQSEREFHLARQKECQTMAHQASSNTARIAHEGLAHEHARRAREISEKPDRK
jgi:hypothetical protein